MHWIGAILAVIGCKLLVGALVVFGLLWLLFGSALALTPQAPPIIIPADGIAFRNVVESSDLLVVYRYNLPAGFDDEDEPQDWQVHGVNGVLARMMFDGQTQQDRVPPSLGHALGAFYLAPGHNAEWGSEDTFVRMQGNPALFTNVNQQDRALNFSASGADSVTLVVASEVRRQALCDVFVGELEAIEQADAELSSGDLVSGGIITAEGTLMARDAFSGIVSILPECFVVGVEGSGQAFDPPEGQLRTDLVAEVEASDYWARWEAFTDSHDMPAALTATVIAVALSFGVMIAVTAWTGVMFGTASGVVSLLAFALWVPHWLLQVVLVIVAVSTILAVAFFWRRIPTV